MCGVAGLLNRDGAWSAEELHGGAAEMAARLAHRGPDGSGVWVDALGGLGFGHARLAIIDLSPAGAQPMLSSCGRWAICYNGEIYNTAELRVELLGRGVVFRGHSDTEVIVEAIALWGVAKVLPRLVGMFALALWDRETRELVLARDRAGEKPLYWRKEGARFAFASELDALLGAPGFETPAVSEEGVAAYLRYGCVPAPLTIHDRIYKLAPGEALFWRDSAAEPEISTYWSLADVVRRARAHPLIETPEEVDALIEPLLRRAVAERLVSDAPLGAFLSGGIDSSLVAALMREISQGQVRTFSIGFESDDYNEAPHAKAVAAHLGCDHQEHYVAAADLLALSPRLAAIYGEPFADSSQIPTMLLSEMTREHVAVALSGDGGDEVFGGYNRYLWAGRLSKLRRRLGKPGRALAAGILRGAPAVVWDGWAARALMRRRGPHNSQARRAHRLGAMMRAGDDDAAYLALISQWMDICPPAWTRPPPGVAELRRTDLSDPAERMQFLDISGYLPDDILTKVDRATMAHGLEARAPLLDHRLIEASWRLAPAAKIQNGVGKAPLRRILRRHVPDSLIERPKMGFGAPIDSWLRGELREWSGDLLASLGWLEQMGGDLRPIAQAWRDHQSGRANHGDRLWTALMLAQWRVQTRATNNSRIRPSRPMRGAA